jgi:hypothetical protein
MRLFGNKVFGTTLDGMPWFCLVDPDVTVVVWR